MSPEIKMIFRTLVENLIRETGQDSLVVHTLTRELEHDLIAAFRLSRPLVDAHPDLFWQSRSYLDFLIQISNLPSFRDCLSPQDPVTFPRSAQVEDWELEQKLKACESERDACQDRLEACQTRIRSLEDEVESWKAKAKEWEEKCGFSSEKTLRKTLAEYEAHVQKYRSQLEDVERDLESCRKKNNDLEKNLVSQEDHWGKKSCALQKELGELQCKTEDILKNKEQRYQELWNSCKAFVENNRSILKENESLINELGTLSDEKSILYQQSQRLLEQHKTLSQTTEELMKSYCTLVSQKTDSTQNETAMDQGETEKEDSASQCIEMLDSVSFTESTLLRVLQEAYRTEECPNWQEKALHQFPQERRLLHTFQHQLEKIQNHFRQFELTPENLAVKMIELCNTVPIYFNLLKSLAKVVSVENFEAIEAVVQDRFEWIAQLHNNFRNIRYEDWKVQLARQIQQLVHIYPDLDDFLKLHQECQKLANHFNVVLDPRTFFNQIVRSEKIKECESLKSYYEEFQKFARHFNIALDPRTFSEMIQKCESLKSYLQNFFNVSDPSAQSLDQRIQHTFQTEVLEETFEKQIQKYREQVEQEWVQFYNSLMGYLKLNATLPADASALKRIYDRIQEICQQDNEQWIAHYREWVHLVTGDTTMAPSDFLDRLRAFKDTPKRSSAEMSMEDESEKKAKTKNYTLIEIQNVIHALYKEFFKLKWQIYNNKYPTEMEIMDKLKQKLSILEQLDVQQRLNETFAIFLRYVKFDLEILTGKTELFNEIVSMNDMLLASMRDTESFLKNLLNIENTSCKDKPM